MSTTTSFFGFIFILAILFLIINFNFAPHKPYLEKDSTFECGYPTFLGQNRSQFNISFFIFAILFLLFDLEILLIFPYALSSYSNEIYGLITMFIFFIALTSGFAFEINKNALKIDSRQIWTKNNKDVAVTQSCALHPTLVLWIEGGADGPKGKGLSSEVLENREGMDKEGIKQDIRKQA